MKISMGMILATTVFSFLNCNQMESVQQNPDSIENSKKAPLVFDTSTILTPPLSLISTSKKDNSLKKAASTYYMFGIGSGLSSADKDQSFLPSGHPPMYWNFQSVMTPQIPSAYGSFVEATYSSRLAAAPEDMWITNGSWLQAGTVLDYEQVEAHYFLKNTAELSGSTYWSLEVDYSINTELNYDYLWINGTTAGSACNNPGSVFKKVSGNVSGNITLSIANWSCPDIWVGIYFIKDGSVTAPGEYVRINNVGIRRMGSLGTH